MTEQTPEPYEPAVEPIPPRPRNNLLGLALFAVFLVLFGGTFLVGLIYLAFD